MLGIVSVDTDYIMATFPVKSIADLKGRKIGAAGSLALWIQGIGGVPVNGDFSTHYNNVKTGVYDGLIALSSGAYPTKLHQVAPYITRIDLGSMTTSAISVNKAFYDGLPADVQKVLREAGKEYTTRTAALLLNVAKDFEEKMVAEGANVSRLPAEERRKWANSMPNIALAWVERNEARGVPARKVLSAYMQKLRENKVELVRDWDRK
jgi:TRAP-type C4-dicarboxylate transport system substrate-binding protein